MKNIVIIGAGQLGSRHLQGIAQCTFDMSIYVVDPSEESRRVAEQRFQDVNNHRKGAEIHFLDSIDKVCENIDIAIVATNSDIRAEVVSELVKKKTVKNLILEKVLFQKISDYGKIHKLLHDHNIPCWVNHPRRMFPVYKWMKEQLAGASQISYSLQGGGWGLGCNGLHFIDHLSYLSGASELSVSNSFLDKYIYDSKRKDFKEFNGLLTGKIGNHNFSLNCNSLVSPVMLSINSDVFSAIVNESKGEISYASKSSDWSWKEKKGKIVLFQSELSGILINEILEGRGCSLPTYEDAIDLHIPFLESLIDHMKNVSDYDSDLCPIT